MPNQNARLENSGQRHTWKKGVKQNRNFSRRRVKGK
jgi:hypothetical protein